MRSSTLWTALFALTLVLSAAPEARALSVGAPVRSLDPGGFSLSGTLGYTSLDIRDFDVTTKSFFFKGAFGSSEGVMPYLKLGFADLEMDGGFEGNMKFAYGGGILLDLMRQESGSGFRASFDAQVQWSDSTDGNESRDLFEGQLSLLGSVRTGGTTTYAGLSSSFLNLDGAAGHGEENGRGHLFFGLDYYIDYNFYFSAEAHLFGQNTLALGVGYQF